MNLSPYQPEFDFDVLKFIRNKSFLIYIENRHALFMLIPKKMHNELVSSLGLKIYSTKKGKLVNTNIKKKFVPTTFFRENNMVQKRQGERERDR